MHSILVVDDNPNVRSCVREFLEQRADFCVCEAIDGLDAVEKAKEHRPDLVIIDLSMPRLNGLDASWVLKSMMEEVPIILFTLYVDRLTSSEVSAAGVDAVFSKTDITGLVKYVDNRLSFSSPKLTVKVGLPYLTR